MHPCDDHDVALVERLSALAAGPRSSAAWPAAAQLLGRLGERQV